MTDARIVTSTCLPTSLPTSLFDPMGDNGRSPEGIPQLTGIRAEAVGARAASFSAASVGPKSE